MRRPLIAGNWKMNLSTDEAVRLATDVAAGAEGLAAVDFAVFPAFVHLAAVAAVVRDSAVGLGAQNMYPADNGAFTGEISPLMLRDLGATHVILGHSERRHVLGETDEDVAQKTEAAIRHGLVPVVCVGETLEQRQQSQTEQVIATQFAGSLGKLTEEAFRQVQLAYEPVWAIGTGQVATPEQAEAVHLDLRKQIEDRYNSAVASQVRILYGGSVKPDNAASLLSQPNVDGALVGGASLKAADFLAIAQAAAACVA